MPKRTISPLGRKIRGLLKQHRISGRELGRRLGVSTGTVSNWCFDTWPQIEEIQKLAKEFNIPLQSLLADYEDRMPGLKQEVLSAVGRTVRNSLQKRGLTVDDITWERYDHLVALAYGRVVRDELLSIDSDESKAELKRFLDDLMPLLTGTTTRN